MDSIVFILRNARLTYIHFFYFLFSLYVAFRRLMKSLLSCVQKFYNITFTKNLFDVVCFFFVYFYYYCAIYGRFTRCLTRCRSIQTKAKQRNECGDKRHHHKNVSILHKIGKIVHEHFNILICIEMIFTFFAYSSTCVGLRENINL